MKPSRIAPLLVWLLVSVAVTLAAYRWTYDKALEGIRSKGTRQLEIYALDLQSALDKFETLPYVLSLHPDVVRALQLPADRGAVDVLNDYLQAVQQQANVAAIYAVESSGNTLAASNWNTPQSFVGSNYTPQSFVGSNYGFRPYFQDAMRGQVGRFYAIGSTTAEPGYFLAHPVYARRSVAHKPLGAPIGVIAIKISLDEFEAAWRASDEPIALADGNGVVFLSSVPAWKYHSLTPLAAPALAAIEQTQQYVGKSIAPLALPEHRGVYEDYLERSVGPLGWRLLLFAKTGPAENAAWNSAIACMLAAIIGGLVMAGVYLRRRHAEATQQAQRALREASAELERKIAQRTQDLVQANQELESKYSKLKDAEQLLRSTQNELIQAGKLALLGQMAAGVTHELSQPLTSIRAFAENAVTLTDNGDVGSVRKNLQHISAACGHMGNIISQLKGLARKSDESLSLVDLGEASAHAALLLQSEFRRHQVQLDVVVRHSPKILGDSVRVEQVLINLLRNAIDAVELAEHKWVSIVIDTEEHWATVRIHDSGAGIPIEVRERLFEPFFTTKPAGKGLGLGLAISSSIVQAMDGELIASNRAAGGAEFLMRLPLAKA